MKLTCVRGGAVTYHMSDHTSSLIRAITENARTRGAIADSIDRAQVHSAAVCEHWRRP